MIRRRRLNKRYYEKESDLDQIYRFLSETYRYNKRVDNWDSARWFFNRYCIHSYEELTGKREWTKSIQIWENLGKIVGVSHSEEANDFFIHLDSQYSYMFEELFCETLEHARSLNLDHTHINVSSLMDDMERISIFKRYNGEQNDFLDENRRLLLKNYIKHDVDIKGYMLINIDVEDRLVSEKVAQLYSKIWPTSSYISNGKTVMNLVKASGYRNQLSFSAVDECNDFVAFYFIWSSFHGKHAHLYPFGIDRTYHNKAVAKNILLEGVNRLADLEYESLSLGAWYCDEDEALFKEIGFEHTSPCVSYRFKL